MEDVIVVGAGPAGLAAAAWLARYRRKVLVVDAGEPRNRWTEAVHGYLGLDPIPPEELLRRGREDLLRYPTVSLRDGRATTARMGQGGFVVEVDGEELLAHRLVLATGVRDRFPDLDGFFDHYGRAVFHCPACDGYEARDRDVVALGWAPHVAGFALELLDWARSVTVVANAQRFEGDREHRAALERNGIRLVEDEAHALLGAPGALEGVRLAGGEQLDCDMLFFSIAHEPADDLADELGCRRTEGGECVWVDEHGQTSVEGVYAAGDMTPGTQLAQIAAAQGVTAGVACALSLRGERTFSDAPSPGPDVGRELRAAEG
jgi:thioredoxin reductase